MPQRRRIARVLLVLLSVLLVSLSITLISSQVRGLSFLSHAAKSAPLSAGTVTEYPIPTPISEPVGIASGPDGNLWFTEGHGNNIGKITTSGQITEYALPHAESEPEGITSGPDGNLWFTEFSSVYGNRIGKITVSGQITEYTLPNSDSEPESIATGPDGNLWFTEFDGDRIGTITPSGTITEYTLPNADSEPEGITNGPCGDSTQADCLWFTEYGLVNTQTDSANIGRITTNGVITEYPLSTRYARANDITLGPNGTLYFTQQANNGSDTGASVQATIGQVTTAGQVQMSALPPLPNGGCIPNSITEGSDGNLWFTEYYQIGSMTPGGALIEYPLPTGSSSFLPDNIAAGSDGNLWFTEFTGGNIGRITI
ncbi:MAG: Virginiamycin B lyase [Ktedonobacteraceae bacterium]